MQTYKIIDEPAVSRFSRVATNPSFPLFSVMLASPIFGWIWFVVNSLAIGSPTKLKECLAAGAGVIIMSLFYSYLIFIQEGGAPKLIEYIDYIRLLGVIISISISYYLFVMQRQPFSLYEYFGGATMNGIPILILGFLVGQKVQLFILMAIMKVTA